MTGIISKCVGVCALALAAGCSVGDVDNHRIDVTEQNDLGVTTLQTTRVVQDHGDNVFTLRAFSAEDQELASVRLTIGAIPDISEWVPGAGDLGSEIVVSAKTEVRILSRETQRFALQPDGADPSIVGFLQISAVSSALQREANIFVANRPTADSSESAYLPYETTVNCPSNFMLSSPVATQCCLDQIPTNNQYTTHHINAATQAAVQRTRNPNGGLGCKASDGTSSCDGSACYFGPGGFSRPSTTLPTPQDPYGFTSRHAIGRGESWCIAGSVASPPTPLFADVTGTLPTNCGCCGNGSGPCCGTACSSCTVAPQDAAAGRWDF